jgi:diguanylate cyclase (GGDEF)-like protein
MFLDLDRFKNVNDTLGHHIGDILLLEVSQRLATTIRESDVVARLGGDEFVVVLTGIEVPYVQRVAEKILAALAEPYQLEGHELHTTASIGIAIYPDDGNRVDTLMQNADAAMYHAKSAGRNNAQFFTASMNEAVRDRHELESDLHLAIQRGELLLYYQPQMDANRQPIGAEALLRWQHPTRGLVSPLKFIPLAEENGLILPIGHWVIETACQQILVWAKDERTARLQLAVNVSARQFRQPDFVEQVREAVMQSGINPSCLKLELTESLVLDNVEETIRTMQEIKKLGVVFSMDDFGTGYSSLSYLARLPLDQLKIDRAFVAKLPDSPSDAIIAQTIITMGRSLGLEVIAEGVETEAQCQFLGERGCQAYQGYLFSQPLPAEKLAEYFSAQPTT